MLGSQLLLESTGLEHLLLTFRYSILFKIGLLSAASQVRNILQMNSSLHVLPFKILHNSDLTLSFKMLLVHCPIYEYTCHFPLLPFSPFMIWWSLKTNYDYKTKTH